ncbi:hypothetical protein LguiA_013122 [Lonicera macranthoides]
MELERKHREEPPVAFDYCPAEGILLHQYLRRRCAGHASKTGPIAEEDVYTKRPQQLIAMYPHMGEHGWYFFTPRFVENQGQWRTSGKKDFVFYKGRRVGSKEVLEFFEEGEKTKYKIIEYNLEGDKSDVCVCKLYEDGSPCGCVEAALKAKSIKDFIEAFTRKAAEVDGNLNDKCNELKLYYYKNQGFLEEYHKMEQRLNQLEKTFSNEMELESKQICNRREPSLGFVFRPADGILLDHYLRNRCTGKAMEYCPIETEVDVYAKDPRQLIGMYPHMGEHVWYFFSPSFVENQGQWRTSGKKDFVFYNGQKVGSKQVLEFFEEDERTKYKIIEYNLERDKSDVCVCKLFEDGSLCSCVESALKEESTMATMKSLSIRVPLQKKFKNADGAAASVENITFERLQDLTEKCNELRRRYMINQASLEEYYEAERRLYWLWKAFLKKTELKSLQIELKKWKEREEGYQSLGFIFRPTEGFLVDHYLRKAFLDELMEGSCPISDIGFYRYHPRDLTEICPHSGKNVWYFFSPCLPEKVYPGDDQGQWRINGRESAVYHEGKKVGNMLLLEHFEGNQKSNYKIIQYKLKHVEEEFYVYKMYEDETTCSCEKYPACSLRRRPRKESLGHILYHGIREYYQ